MSEAILESRTLANGTTLTLCDASRRQAADRWIVVLEARVSIPTQADCLPADLMGALSLETVRSLLGETVTYTSRMERVFVSDEDKQNLLTRFQDDFNRNTVPYLATPAFPARFVRKQCHEVRQRRAWQAAAADSQQDAT